MKNTLLPLATALALSLSGCNKESDATKANVESTFSSEVKTSPSGNKEIPNISHVTEVKVFIPDVSKKELIQQKVDSILNMKWAAQYSTEPLDNVKYGPYMLIKATSSISGACRDQVTKTIVSQVDKSELSDEQSRGLLFEEKDVQIWEHDYSDNFNSGTLLSAIKEKCTSSEVRVDTGYTARTYLNYVTVVTKTEEEGENLMKKLRTIPEIKNTYISVDKKIKTSNDYVVEYKASDKSH